MIIRGVSASNGSPRLAVGLRSKSQDPSRAGIISKSVDNPNQNKLELGPTQPQLAFSDLKIFADLVKVKMTPSPVLHCEDLGVGRRIPFFLCQGPWSYLSYDGIGISILPQSGIGIGLNIPVIGIDISKYR